MPNRTIYISDADLPIFEQAQQLAGDNLSATIVTALRRFIEMYQQRQEGFKDITVKVGNEVYTQKRFNGRLLAKGRFHGSNKKRYEILEVYQTHKNNIVLYVRDTPDWSSWTKPAYSPQEWAERSNWNADDWRGRFTFEVFEALEQIRERVPAELYQVAEQNLHHGPVEVLDI